MKLRVNVPKFIPPVYLPLLSFGYIIVAGYLIGSGYE